MRPNPEGRVVVHVAWPQTHLEKTHPPLSLIGGRRSFQRISWSEPRQGSPSRTSERALECSQWPSENVRNSAIPSLCFRIEIGTAAQGKPDSSFKSSTQNPTTKKFVPRLILGATLKKNLRNRFSLRELLFVLAKFHWGRWWDRHPQPKRPLEWWSPLSTMSALHQVR